MRLHILSDLHLSVAPLEVPRVAADVVVLAGDIGRPTQAVAWAEFEAPVLYVPGNHEFYGGAIEDTISELRELCVGTNVRLLERDEVFLCGARFLGTTLWPISAFMEMGRRATEQCDWRKGLSASDDCLRRSKGAHTAPRCFSLAK